MIGKNFPVSDYYKDHIIDGLTISRTGSWWTAILVIEEPASKKKIIGLYRWKLKDGAWKTHKNFKINSKKDAAKIIDVISTLSEKI